MRKFFMFLFIVFILALAIRFLSSCAGSRGLTPAQAAQGARCGQHLGRGR